MGNLTLEDRIVIQTMIRNGHKIIEIAKYLNRNKTTIYREIEKLPENRVYDAKFSHELTNKNMVRTKSVKRKKNMA